MYSHKQFSICKQTQWSGCRVCSLIYFIMIITKSPVPLYVLSSIMIITKHSQPSRMEATHSTCWAGWEATWANSWPAWWACKGWGCQAWWVHIFFSKADLTSPCGRAAWEEGCQWTTPSSPACGVEWRAGRCRWAAGGWWRWAHCYIWWSPPSCSIYLVKLWLQQLKNPLLLGTELSLHLHPREMPLNEYCLSPPVKRFCLVYHNIGMREVTNRQWRNNSQFGLGGSLPGPPRERGEVCRSLKASASRWFVPAQCCTAKNPAFRYYLCYQPY